MNVISEPKCIRLNAHTEDNDVSFFPTNFLEKVLYNKHDWSTSLELANQYYPELLTSRMIIMPFMEETHQSVLVLINPAGIIDDKYVDRSLSFMMLLDPSGRPKKKLTRTIARRLRLFLKHLAIMKNANTSDRTYTDETFKLYTPQGQFFPRL